MTAEGDPCVCTCEYDHLLPSSGWRCLIPPPQVVMGSSAPTPTELLVARTKGLSYRSYALAAGLLAFQAQAV